MSPNLIFSRFILLNSFNFPDVNVNEECGGNESMISDGPVRWDIKVSAPLR